MGLTGHRLRPRRRKAGSGSTGGRPWNSRLESRASRPAAQAFLVLTRSNSVHALADQAATPAARPLLASIAGDMAAMDRTIRAKLGSDVALINSISDYILAAGGKRLRPAVLMLCARALGYQGAHHHTLGAVVELIHTATLLHDDVVDESELRRGRSTANTLFGNAASVLVGDFLYSRAFQMMVEVGDAHVLRILADATNRIAEGEVLQLLNVHDPSVDEARYLRVIESKTATLFEAAARIGAVIAAAPPAVEADCARIGAKLGTAFQIIDDVLDYSGELDDIGKRLGDDLREGKATLPLIHALRSSDASQRSVLSTAIADGGGDFATIAAILRDAGSIDYARRCARQVADEAQELIDRLPHSIYRDTLLDLNAFAVRRTA
jgi:octaprenyl-diphosphate synthase